MTLFHRHRYPRHRGNVGTDFRRHWRELHRRCGVCHVRFYQNRARHMAGHAMAADLRDVDGCRRGLRRNQRYIHRVFHAADAYRHTRHVVSFPWLLAHICRLSAHLGTAAWNAGLLPRRFGPWHHRGGQFLLDPVVRARTFRCEYIQRSHVHDAQLRQEKIRQISRSISQPSRLYAHHVAQLAAWGGY